MLYSDDEIKKAYIFKDTRISKIQLFAIVKDPSNSFINLYLRSHNKYYVLSHFNNYPDIPFVEMEELDSVNELNFHEKSNYIYYKINKEDQNLKFLKKDKNGIHSNLFDLKFDVINISELLNNKKSNLYIDNKYIINERDYYDIKKELLDEDEIIKIENTYDR